MKQLILILSLVSFGVNANTRTPEFRALARASASVIDTMCLVNMETDETRSECFDTYTQLVSERMGEELLKILENEE
ncbi:hypothetical protein LJT19_000935 [Salmonella enterica]|nr:hypothetical protein [Salmonella enterica]